MLKPIIKWVGGKRQIMDELIKFFPKKFNNYYEPFVGGGSVVLELWNNDILKNKQIMISDILDPLMNMFDVIKKYPNELIKELSSELYKNDKEQYGILKQEFNNIKTKITGKKVNGEEIMDSDLVYYASLFLFLNRTGFNGIYRENLKGEYNIPFGKQKNPVICNTELIKTTSLFLNEQNVEIKQCDYREIEKYVKKGDFIYIDPPYYNTFNSYSKTNFKKLEQVQLCEFYKRLTDLGCKVALSNSDDIFIRELYKNIPCVKIKEISVRRMVNCDIEGRKELKKELLILNY